jgi:hypothetical protein
VVESAPSLLRQLLRVHIPGLDLPASHHFVFLSLLAVVVAEQIMVQVVVLVASSIQM